ncbi:MAG: hypothetical protein V4510_12445 [bacterium]
MATVECLCPPTAAGEVRHPAGDTVTLRERLGFQAALSVQNAALIALEKGGDDADVSAAMTEKYLFVGIESWSVVDAKGKRVEPNRQTITDYLLVNIPAAVIVANEADGLYDDQVSRPLLQRVSNSSQPSPTPASTSPTTGSEQRPPKPSKRSSTTSSRMDGIAATT